MPSDTADLFVCDLVTSGVLLTCAAQWVERLGVRSAAAALTSRPGSLTVTCGLASRTFGAAQAPGTAADVVISVAQLHAIAAAVGAEREVSVRDDGRHAVIRFADTVDAFDVDGARAPSRASAGPWQPPHHVFGDGDEFADLPER